MHPSKSEIATTDTTGLMKCWSLVEITSALNNNEAVTTDSQYTWSCTFQSWRSNEAITMVRYGYDSSVYAVARTVPVSAMCPASAAVGEATSGVSASAAKSTNAAGATGS